MFALKYILRAAVLAAAVLAGALVRAQEGGDLQAQILYAFYTQDTHELEKLMQSLTTQVKAGGAGAALRYHLAHAQYRTGLLEAPGRSGAAAEFLDCADSLKPVLEQDVKSVEALALQSACYSNLAKYRHLEAALLRSRAADRLAEGYTLAPRNPRVLYLMALAGLERAKPGSPENSQAFAELEQAAEIFEQTSATSIDVPGWGNAEAYLTLGTQLASRGDVLGARNWIEKSLIAAPDFKAAQLQLASLVQR